MRFWHNDPQLKSINPNDFERNEITLHGFIASYFLTPYSPSDPLAHWPVDLPTPDQMKETDSGFLFCWDLHEPVRLTCHAKLVEVVWNAYALLLRAPLDFPISFERLQLNIRPLTTWEANQERLRTGLLLHV